MKRSSLLFAAALALLGCSPVVAPVAPESTPLVPVTPAPTAVPLILGADAAGAELRTLPPPLDPSIFSAPISLPLQSITEIVLADGARARVIERHDLPVVHVALFLAAARSPASDLLCASVLRTSTAGDETLSTDLDANGVSIKWFGCDVAGLHLHFDVVPARVEPTLIAIVDALRSGAPTAARLDEARRQRLESLPKEPTRDRLMRAADGLLYPVNDPAHDGPSTPAAALTKLTLADLARARAARRPELMTLSIVGDVELPALRQALDRVAARWPAEKRAPASAPAKPSALGHGVVLVEEPTQNEVEIGLLFPLPQLSAPDRITALALESLLPAVLSDRPAQGEAARLRNVGARLELDAQRGLLRFVAFVPTGGVAAALKKMLADLAAFSASSLHDSDVQQMRGVLGSRLAHNIDGGAAQADWLRFLTQRGSMDDHEQLYRVLPTLDREAPAAFAKRWLTPERAVFAALGPVADEKAAIEALGLGKAKVIRAPAPAKGASK